MIIEEKNYTEKSNWNKNKLVIQCINYLDNLYDEVIDFKEVYINKRKNTVGLVDNNGKRFNFKVEEKCLILM